MVPTSEIEIVPHAPDAVIDRGRFLWNQQKYLLENIKLADTKAGFVLTISAALLSASLSPNGRLAFHLSKLESVHSYVATVLFDLGIVALVTATVMSAWSIKPRLLSHAKPSPVSWVNVAKYDSPEAFRAVNRSLTEEESADLLCDQVFWMARIGVAKHTLISRAISLALVGGLLVAVAIVAR